ncbi:MAG: 30S ribosomal protein S8 [Candidatus Eremiobacteraeota bacterium]|nr:30S ribosomal protein S8 [Candidatus Eremiobacteraeota bacterium]MBV8204967.1 30S ribosomal protein S8 [Candidatus Eremiobacteraeota bacterium]MBV8262516.1 30S ribosomal protein S8 [Candidatus Eremiobacteraeota bacterium]MBV8339303.1 30S ribosomal protein S8 [Candidatus Eremiobacteraeota bacterium]MBV8461558.1 30S ribosomal protein S8 [Candidatus Eremiobacteraeota bacterium]
MAVITDPVADMLARIRNANIAHHERVDIPASRLKRDVARVLKDEGFVKNVEIVAGAPRDLIRITLKYGQHRERVINGLQRISRPGLRIYTPKGDIPKCMGGLGLVIMSTSQGIMSGRQAKRLGCGGEVMAYVW